MKHEFRMKIELLADVYYEDEMMTVEIPKGEYTVRNFNEIKVGEEWLDIENVQDQYGRKIELVY